MISVTKRNKQHLTVKLMENKHWLAFANRDSCHHAESLLNLGFINWTMHRTKFSIGDIVYLYMSDERRIRFKTQVIAENCKREDQEYWQIAPTSHPTYKLSLVAEYTGHDLDENPLRQHGFNGGRSIEKPMYNNPPLFRYINDIFDKETNYGHIIDDVCPKARSREIVRQIIPILIRWAKQGLTTKTYDDLIKELGYDSSFSGIGRQLGYIDDVFNKLGELTHEKIPTLNALVKSKSTHLPSPGFSYVYTTYDEMTNDEKHIFVTGLNDKAIEYEHWDWVLSSLQLTPSVIDTKENEKAIRSGKLYGTGGEGENHKKIKEFIFKHPESIGIKCIKTSEMEHILLSGDRLDVYFVLSDGSTVAVEVKPSTSPDADILRGLFQCVKYKVIMDAEDKIHAEKNNHTAILVIGGSLSIENQKVRDTLGIKVIENFDEIIK